MNEKMAEGADTTQHTTESREREQSPAESRGQEAESREHESECRLRGAFFHTLAHYPPLYNT
jgi:hypothetical protein